MSSIKIFIAVCIVIIIAAAIVTVLAQREAARVSGIAMVVDTAVLTADYGTDLSAAISNYPRSSIDEKNSIAQIASDAKKAANNSVAQLAGMVKSLNPIAAIFYKSDRTNSLAVSTSRPFPAVLPAGYMASLKGLNAFDKPANTYYVTNIAAGTVRIMKIAANGHIINSDGVLLPSTVYKMSGGYMLILDNYACIAYASGVDGGAGIYTFDAVGPNFYHNITIAK